MNRNIETKEFKNINKGVMNRRSHINYKKLLYVAVLSGWLLLLFICDFLWQVSCNLVPKMSASDLAEIAKCSFIKVPQYIVLLIFAFILVSLITKMFKNNPDSQ